MMISKLLFAEIIVENPCPVQKALMENRNLIMMQGRVYKLRYQKIYLLTLDFNAENIKCRKYELEANQNKNHRLVSIFYNKLKFTALFSVLNRWENSARDFNLL